MSFESMKNSLKGKQKPRVCIIGAGTAGLCTLRHCLDHNLNVVCFEQNEKIGGTWIYNENIPDDPLQRVHSSIYEGLRTNLPKEVMGFPDFQYPDTIEESYIPALEVLKYLESYAEHFKLRPYIKLEHEVMRVRPRNGHWEVYVKDLKVGQSEQLFFDFVFVCNGHFTDPAMPEIEGMDIYRGQQIHSHLFRKAEKFKDANVLIIGAGPSGMDIATHVSKTAKNVFLSHHLEKSPPTEFLKVVTQKPDVKHFTEHGAVFTDGTTEEFAFVIFCTGYKYTFPFISTDSGFHVDDNWVQPLWKQCIVIQEPTMAIIGLPYKIIPTAVIDIQVRFVLKFYTGQLEIPTEQQMLDDMRKEMDQRWQEGLPKKHAHLMAFRQYDYYNDLCSIANIDNLKPVFVKMMRDAGQRYIYELETYRNFRYQIIDDEQFIRYPLVKS